MIFSFVFIGGSGSKLLNVENAINIDTRKFSVAKFEKACISPVSFAEPLLDISENATNIALDKRSQSSIAFSSFLILSEESPERATSLFNEVRASSIYRFIRCLFSVLVFSFYNFNLTPFSWTIPFSEESWIFL